MPSESIPESIGVHLNEHPIFENTHTINKLSQEELKNLIKANFKELNCPASWDLLEWIGLLLLVSLVKNKKTITFLKNKSTSAGRTDIVANINHPKTYSAILEAKCKDKITGMDIDQLSSRMEEIDNSIGFLLSNASSITSRGDSSALKRIEARKVKGKIIVPILRKHLENFLESDLNVSEFMIDQITITQVSPRMLK